MEGPSCSVPSLELVGNVYAREQWRQYVNEENSKKFSILVGLRRTYRLCVKPEDAKGSAFHAPYYPLLDNSS